MVIHIKELFLEIINHYDNDLIAYMPTIVNFNRISKRHYEWMKTKSIIQIKDCMIWLNAQKLRKTVNQNPGQTIHKVVIEKWAGYDINIENFDTAILLYNQLNLNKIIGRYPCYNICYPYMYPEEEFFLRHLTEVGYRFGGCKYDYKNFPEIKEIVYSIHCRKITEWHTGRKLNQNELLLLKYQPYMFKWMSDRRPPKN